MIQRIADHVGTLRLAGRERGGVALIMLVGFIGLAVPLAVASIQTGGQLSRNSRVYDSRLAGFYNAGSGLEKVFFDILNDPDFDDGLSLCCPSKEVTVDTNGDTVTVTVTKVFSGQDMQGQALDIDKQVTPTTAVANAPTTFTYTITITNIGAETNTVDGINDILPEGFTYVAGSSLLDGSPTADPGINVLDSSVFDVTRYLNDGASLPYPWDPIQGSDSQTASHTATSTWETLPEYWDWAAPGDGEIIAGQWRHKQWFYVYHADNDWRWKLQHIQGATTTDLFTSDAEQFGAGDVGKWRQHTVSHDASAITLQAGDILRLRLEVYSEEPDPANRRFDYRWGGASGYDSVTNKMPGFITANCGVLWEKLAWNLSPDVPIGPGQELTLSFQATANKPDGTYYNQAWTTYVPWWDTATATTVRTPYTAPVTVGTGDPVCGGGVVVSKTVTPTTPPPDVETTFTYTISMENLTSFDVPLGKIKDLLPPDFTYVTGSTDSGSFWPYEPNGVTWIADLERYEINWNVDQAASVPAGATVTQIFQAKATPDSGFDYFNEAWVKIAPEDCTGCGPTPGNSPKTSTSGPSGGSQIQMPVTYDIQAVAADGTILSRVILQLSGDIDILSWQEY